MWVGDLLVTSICCDVLEAKQYQKEGSECDDLGPVQEYVEDRVNFDWAQGAVMFTQLVLIQSFQEKFGITCDMETMYT